MEIETADEKKASVAEGFIRLVSGDGFSFIVMEEYAVVSLVIKRMMESGFKESNTREIHFPEISGSVLERICQYFYYIPRFHSRQKAAMALAKAGNTDLTMMSSIDAFAETFEVPQELSLELYLAARYLDL